MTKLLRVTALAAIMMACDSFLGPTPCACDPVIVGQGVLYGEVIDPDGHAVENSRVSLHLVSDPPCPGQPSTLGLGSFATTASTGRFRYALAWSGPTAKCYAVWANAPSGSGFSASDTTLRVVTFTSGLSDSTNVQLQLR